MGRTKGGLTSKRHMVSDGQGRPPTVFLSPGRRRVLLAKMPRAKRLLGEKGYKADGLRDGLKARSVRVCNPARSQRNRPTSHTRTLTTTRGRIERACARLTDWRGLARRTTRCADLFLAALALAAVILRMPS